MAGNNRRSIFRRRQAGLTDYRRRLKLLRGRKPRAVVRVSNTRTTCQLVTWAANGDLVTVSKTGSDLVKKHGWPSDGSLKSVPASYLVGFAMGKAAVANGATEAVLDIGLAASSRGGRVYAALKGMVDAVPVEAKAGDIIVFSSLTPHRTGPNQTDIERKSYILQYSHDGSVMHTDNDQQVSQDNPDRQFLVTENGTQLG